MTEYTEGQKAYIEGVKETAHNVEQVVVFNPSDGADVLNEYGIDYYNIKTQSDLVEALDKAEKDLSPEEYKEFVNKLYGAVFHADPPPNVKFEDYKKTILDVYKLGPHAIDNITYNGKIYGMVILPTVQLDTKEEFLRHALRKNHSPEEIEAFIKNTKYDSTAWLKNVGRHEGAHIDGETHDKSPRGLIAEETKVERIALEDAPPEFIREWRAFRALDTYDDEHAVSGPLLSGNPVSKENAEEGLMYDSHMSNIIKDNFNFAAHQEKGGTATTPEELLKERPDLYFATVNEALEKEINKAKQDYEENPTSYYAAHKALEVQTRANYIKAFEDGYRHYILGEDIPECESVRIITGDALEMTIRNTNDFRTICEMEDKDAAAVLDQYDPAKHFDWEKHGGGATKFEDLSGENLEYYLKWERKYLEDLHKKSRMEVLQNPDYDLRQAIIIDNVVRHYGKQYNQHVELARTINPETDANYLFRNSVISADLSFAYYSLELVKRRQEEFEAQKQARASKKSPEGLTGNKIKTNTSDATGDTTEGKNADLSAAPGFNNQSGASAPPPPPSELPEDSPALAQSSPPTATPPSISA